MWAEQRKNSDFRRVLMARDPKSLLNLKPFPPGVSGNPNGAPKGKRWKTVLKEFLEMQAILPSIDYNTSAKESRRRDLLEQFEKHLGRALTNRDVIAFYQMLNAQEGSIYAFRMISEREEGKPAEEAPEEPGGDDPFEGQRLTTEELGELIKIARGDK